MSNCRWYVGAGPRDVFLGSWREDLGCGSVATYTKAGGHCIYQFDGQGHGLHVPSLGYSALRKWGDVLHRGRLDACLVEPHVELRLWILSMELIS